MQVFGRHVIIVRQGLTGPTALDYQQVIAKRVKTLEKVITTGDALAFLQEFANAVITARWERTEQTVLAYHLGCVQHAQTMVMATTMQDVEVCLQVCVNHVVSAQQECIGVNTAPGLPLDCV